MAELMANDILEPPGQPRLTGRASEIIAKFDESHMSASAAFGPVSKATYIVTWAALTEMFRLYTSIDSVPHREEVRPSLEFLRSRLDSLFSRMTMAPRPEREILTARAGERAGEKEHQSYVFTGEDSEMRAGRALVQPHVTDFATLVEGGREGTYLYAASETSGVRVFQKPLSFTELMHGARFESTVVKHPMLVSSSEPVICAGEMFLSFTETRNPAVFVTRASGHYQPLMPAEHAVVELLREDHLLHPWAVQSLSKAVT
ncbi:hypothetical protein PV721_12385 [Streptomyces sp. MB09-01]|uniref:hypothetical protein n=1 Tax=Streptomyces sp. MB09-01 TaxID=3028666 RepID=UPI0029BC2878|nr:hypothetical protein [Streptomyces sp. MB09-01]MDX3535158.1 hypothetical protein [Streptomyces sp. MB09-01]